MSLSDTKTADRLRKETGGRGEGIVRAHLEQEGYEILEQNYSIPNVGEIDIIAKKGDVIAFVEVKTRGENPLVRPVLAVNKEKQRRICKTAILFLKREHYHLQPRFDVAEVILASQNGALIEKSYQYYKNAFQAPADLRYF